MLLGCFPVIVLYYEYDELLLLDINSNSNIFSKSIIAPNYNFTNDFGFEFDKNSKIITFKSQGNLFLSDVNIQGTLNATHFPANLLQLDEFNKIPSTYLPAMNNGIIYNNNAIGIGTTNPITKFQINDGDALINNGRLGIGITTQPSYYFHLNKNDSMPFIPAFVITSNNYHLFDIFTEKKLIIINNQNTSLNQNLSSNVKLAVYGEIQTDDLSVISNLKLGNELIINKLNSSNNQIIINDKTDLILSNNSLGAFVSNFNNLNLIILKALSLLSK